LRRELRQALAQLGLPLEHLVAARRADAVVLGSAVYMRRWRPEARRFLRRFRRELAHRPFWVFSSGPVGDPADDNAA